MFNRLIDLIIEFVSLFQCWVYIDHYEQAVILRRGKFHRVVNPGWRWIWPLAFEDVIAENVKPEPMFLEVQSLVTRDNYTVNICIGIEWKIVDIFLFVLEFESSPTTVSMLASGVVTDRVIGKAWNDISCEDFVKKLRAPMNRKVKKRGAEITEVVMIDCSNGESIRYWHDGIDIDLGE